MSGRGVKRWGGAHLARLMVVCLLCLAPAGSLVRAQQDERSVRAAFVYNLTKYISWPRSGDEFLIGYIGDGAMGQILKNVVEGKVSEGKRIRVLLHPSEGELQRCNILYLSSSAPNQVRVVLDKMPAGAILTVGENDRFVREGGMVGLVRTGDQIQLEINLDVARAAGLRVSSRLLNLAVIVSSEKKG